jgi:hypothetical protein
MSRAVAKLAKLSPMRRDAISFGRVRGYDELAKIALVILSFNSSSERLASYAGSRARPAGSRGLALMGSQLASRKSY